MQNALPTEMVKLMATIDPDAYAPGAQTSDRVDAGQFASIMAVAYVGDMGTAGTVDFKVQQHDAASSGNTKDITDASITQLTQAGSDDNKQAIINLNTDKLDVTNGYRWVSVVMTVGDTTSPASATTDCGAAIYGIGPRYSNLADLASVDEIVSV